MKAYIERTYRAEQALIATLNRKGRTHQANRVQRRLKGFHDYLTGLGYVINTKTGDITHD